MKTFLTFLVVMLCSLPVTGQTTNSATDIIPTVEYSVTATPDAQPSRPAFLPTLYAAQLGLQGYDAYSTLHVLHHGGVEANPLMQTATKTAPVFLAVKGGTAVLTIVAAEKMWKSGHKTAAIGVMLTSNLVMAYVAHHNYTIAQQMR